MTFYFNMADYFSIRFTSKDRRGDRMVVGFTTINAISAYHH